MVLEEDENFKLFLPQKSPKDVLLYSSFNFYLFLKFFFTAYERILFSKTLIAVKLENDLLNSKDKDQEAI